MKYIIVTLVIAAIIAILSQFFSVTENRNDKYFLLVVSIILIISGVYFSYKSEQIKDLETSEQKDKIENTLENTENLKSASIEISDNLITSIDNLKKMNDDVDTLTGNLDSLKRNLNKQIKVIKKTLKRTGEFEKVVNKQLELAEKQFEIERPQIFAYVPGFIEDTMEKDRLNITYYYKNQGGRTATQISENKIVLFYNEKNGIFQHQNLEGEKSEIPNYTPNGGGSNFLFRNRIPKNYLGEEIEVLMLILSIDYKDVATDKRYHETFTFYCNNLKKKDYTFNKATSSFEEISKYYLRQNDISGFYKN